MLKKEQLRPGMEILNVVSGMVGSVRAHPRHPRRLYPPEKWHRRFVAVKVIGMNGKPFYGWWSLENVRHCQKLETKKSPRTRYPILF